MEAPRIQLDALQAELYALQAENRKLREAQPERATLVDVENKLAQTRENFKLVQQVSQLAQADQDGDLEETREAEQDGLRRTIATLEGEVTKARTQLERQSGELEAKREDLQRALKRAEQAEENVLCLEEGLERTCRDAELDRYRALAEEAQKWESREARAYQHIEKLEQEAAALRASARAAEQTETAGQEQMLIGDSRDSGGNGVGVPGNSGRTSSGGELPSSNLSVLAPVFTPTGKVQTDTGLET